MITSTGDLGCWVALSQVPRLGAARFRLLETYFEGDLAKAWTASTRELRAAGIGGAVAQNVVATRDAIEPDQELERLAKCGVVALTWRDAAYPMRLAETADAPPVLYVKGTLLPEDDTSIAVVGTRRPTEYGRPHHCRSLRGACCQKRNGGERSRPGHRCPSAYLRVGRRRSHGSGVWATVWISCIPAKIVGLLSVSSPRVAPWSASLFSAFGQKHPTFPVATASSAG